jgi:hypothetical protein
MEIPQIQKKSHLLSTLERSHIYNLNLHKQQMNDTSTGMNSAIFDIILKTSPHNNGEADYPHLPPNPLPHHVPLYSLRVHVSPLPLHTHTTSGTRYKQVTIQ